MALLASHHTQGLTHKELTPQQALRYAWYVYLVMLATPFLLFLYVTWSLSGGGLLRRDVSLSDGWFIGSVAYMVLIVPASFFVRSRYFKEYWTGGCVAPKNYLTGMLITWTALEIGGLLSLLGCLVSRSLLPSLLPALAAFMMFAVLWPNGRAMICAGRGSSDDPEHYEEPR